MQFSEVLHNLLGYHIGTCRPDAPIRDRFTVGDEFLWEDRNALGAPIYTIYRIHGMSAHLAYVTNQQTGKNEFFPLDDLERRARLLR